MSDGARVRRAVWALTIAALCYSAAHFVQSGILFPLHQENLGKFEEEMPPLRAHLETGEPVHVNNAVQYGPVFFFAVHPLLLWTHDSHQFSNALYALQLACMAIGLLVTCATLKPLVPASDWPLHAAWLVVLWLNFAPLYMTIATKSVETWELALLSVALYSLVRDRTWLLAVALAAAALVKVLPAIFFFYLLITNRRAFVLACAALLALLLVSHALYGPDMGRVVLAEGRALGRGRIVRPALAREPVAQSRRRQDAGTPRNPARSRPERHQRPALAGEAASDHDHRRRLGGDRPRAARVVVAPGHGPHP